MSTPYYPQHYWIEWLVDVQTVSHGCDCPYAYIPLDWVLHSPPLRKMPSLKYLSPLVDSVKGKLLKTVSDSPLV